MAMILGRVLLVLSALLLAAGVCSACECDEGVSVAESFRDSDAVFLGKVEWVTSEGLEIKAGIKVEESWKGVDTKSATLLTRGTNCYLWPVAGQSYVIFGRRTGVGEYQDRACSHSGWAPEAGEQLAYLRGRGALRPRSRPSNYLEVGSAAAVIVLSFVGAGLLWRGLAGRAA